MDLRGAVPKAVWPASRGTRSHGTLAAQQVSFDQVRICHTIRSARVAVIVVVYYW